MPARRSYGTGSLYTTNGTYYGKFRTPDGRQVKRRIGRARTAHEPDGLTKTQAETRLRELMQAEHVVASAERRTLDAAADAWLTHLQATGAKASTVRAYRAALAKWWRPALGDRSLDRVTEADVEDVMQRMRGAALADKTILNYVGVIGALYAYAQGKQRRWTSRNPTAEIELPKRPVYTEIRYLTRTEVWALVDAARPGDFHAIDRALYLTAAMTGLRIGELQALDWRSVDFVHGRIRVRRTWDRKERTFTRPKSRRSERAVPLPDVVAGELERLYQASTSTLEVDPSDDDLVFGDPATRQPQGWRTLYGRLREALTAARLDETFGFHSLRHSYGTALAGRGVPMRTLQEWMGHRDIATTQRYADYCPNPAERDIVEAAFGAPGGVTSGHASAGTNSGTNLREPERI